MRPGPIIVLNGTSSAGKSTILKLLQKIIPEPYLDAGIDRFIWMLPGRYLNRPLWDNEPSVDADYSSRHFCASGFCHISRYEIA